MTEFKVKKLPDSYVKLYGYSSWDDARQSNWNNVFVNTSDWDVYQTEDLGEMWDIIEKNYGEENLMIMPLRSVSGVSRYEMMGSNAQEYLVEARTL